MILTVCANPSVDSFWSVQQINKGTTNRSEDESFYPGGKGIHTALVLSELGQNVTTLGVWGGQTGQWLKSECQKRNISTAGPTVDDWTRICITNQSTTDWDETELLGSGPAVDGDTVQEFLTEYQRLINKDNIEAILISGSTPEGFKDDIYRQLVNMAQKLEIPAYVDASGPLLKKAAEANPHAIHINYEEGKELSGKKKPMNIVRWLSDFCALAAVTAGADGLYLAYKNQILHAFYDIKDSEIFNTVGSGDALLAGLSLAKLTYDDTEKWAAYAAACGSANCIHPELGMLKSEDVEKIFTQVTVNYEHPY